MRQIRAMLHRLRGLFRRRVLENEMNAELQAHLDGLIERNIAAGMSPAEARFAALREFGGVAQIAERARDERRSVWVEQLWRDVRYAARSLAKAPSFTVTAVLTLALGIGVNAALFSLYNKVALRPLPVKDPDGLVRIAGRNSRNSIMPVFNYAEYIAYRESSRTLDGLLAYIDEIRWSVQLAPDVAPVAAFDSGARGPGTVPIELVSENYFSLLGAAMQLGRAFLPDEVRAPGTTPVIVLSHVFWESHFRRDPNVVGTTVTLDRRVFTVIGVTTAEFPGQGMVPPAAWVPLTMGSSRAEDYGPKGPSALRLVGRLAPGITEAQAKAELDSIASRRATEFPGDNAKTSVRLERGLRSLRFDRTPQGAIAITTLFLGFAMVLVIACTNVANLLLARGVSRQTEIGIRLALGASRGRVVRQLLTENGLLCVIGAGIGLGLGIWTLQVLEPIVLAPYLPPIWIAFLKPTPDVRVLGFTALLTIGATLVAGLLPAWHTVRASLFATMRDDGTMFGRRVTPSRMRHMLVIVQVALCLMLLSCMGVLTRNFFNFRKVDPGFDAHGVFAAHLSPNTAIADRNAAFRQALETVRSIPGVAASGAVYPRPYFTNGLPTRIRTVDTAAGVAEEEVPALFVTAGLFETLGFPLLRGRTFQELELHSASRAIIVSESLAHRLWPGQDAVGRTLAVSENRWAAVNARPAPEGAFRDCEVIGVVRDIALQLDDPNPRKLYLAYPLDDTGRAPFFVRPRSDSIAALMEITRAAEARSIGLQFDYRLSFWLEQKVAALYAFASLSGALGLLALAMASVGLYGLMAFTVNQRVREIGVRMALGASTRKVVALFVRQGMRLVAIGLFFGLVGGALFALALEKIFFGVLDTFEPTIFALVTLLFAAIALFACWLPSRRAAKVDPMVALRTE